MFGTHNELIVINILKYGYCVNRPRDVSRDHFSQTGGGFQERNLAIAFFLIHIKEFLTLHVWNVR